MSGHKITGFLGIIPRTSERLLPEMTAQIAENLRLQSGEIKPSREPHQAFIPPVQGEKQAAYRAYNGTTEKWRAWAMDVDVARGPLPPDVEQRYYWTGDACPRYATFSNFGTTDWALGLPAPAAALTVTPAGGAGITVTRFYVWTFANDLGEESAPSPVSTLTSGKIDATWAITGLVAAPTNDRAANYNTTGLKQRLYRTSGSLAAFQLVAERTAAATTWNDTVLDAAMLGDDLISSGWELPPVGMAGIITLPNGSCAGFFGNELIISEPYQPHAWPYKFQVESKIVGIESHGTTIVICTETRPYVADGVTPDVVTVQSVDSIWPCLSKRSVCSVGDGVVYSTRLGMVYIGQAGPRVITKDLYSPEEWVAMTPSSMHCRMADGRLYILFLPVGGSTKQILCFDFSERAQLTSFSGSCNTIYTDLLNGQFYLVSKEVYLFDGLYGSRNTFVWKSKQIESPQRLNYGAGLIEYEGSLTATEIQAAYSLLLADQAVNQAAITAKINVGQLAGLGFNTDPVNGSTLINDPRRPGEYLKYTLLDHDVPVATIDVISGKAFRLPSGYKTDVITHQLVGNVTVRYIKISETMAGLAAI